MAPRKTSRSYKRGRTRQRKFRKARKTVRGHRRSTTGTLYPPLDVRTPHDVQEILKRITKGPVTVVLVYADWCGHCHTLMPHFKAASQLPQRNAQVISVPDYSLKEFNKTINSVNSSAPELNVEGYPSVLLIGPDGTKLSEIPSTKEALESAMVNVAPVAVEAGLAKPASIVSLSNNRRAPSPRKESPEEIVNNVVENDIIPTSRNSIRGNSIRGNSVKNNTMEKINMEPTGLATGPSFEHLRNDDIINRGEDIGVAPSVSTKYTSMLPSMKRNSQKVGTRSDSLSTINIPKSAIKNSMTEKEIDEMTSRREPLSSISNETTSSLIVPSQTSDTIPIRTKAIKGGSLYGIMSQSAYRLAPAAVLLATAAAVMKKTRDRKRTRRSRR
jgi:thiol-disulfide isomerase/thioredoxin